MKPYLDLVEQVLRGESRTDRTGTGTLSVFGTRTVYDLRDGFPVLTTKKMRWRNAIREMLWFLRGETCTATLGSKIWDAWADDSGDCGPIYGAQWRAFNGTGPDQIRDLIRGIKSDPMSRRHLVTAWNPARIPDMALPPCHVMFQVYVSDGTYLDIQLYQRSGDIALGVPFNVIGYSTVLMLLARETGYIPRRLIHVIGDAHIYSSHVTGLKRQLAREPLQAPELVLPDSTLDELLNGSSDDVSGFKLLGYNPCPRIRFPIAV
jgi:thymidylate synthase